MVLKPSSFGMRLWIYFLFFTIHHCDSFSSPWQPSSSPCRTRSSRLIRGPPWCQAIPPATATAKAAAAAVRRRTRARSERCTTLRRPRTTSSPSKPERSSWSWMTGWRDSSKDDFQVEFAKCTNYSHGEFQIQLSWLTFLFLRFVFPRQRSKLVERGEPPWCGSLSIQFCHQQPEQWIGNRSIVPPMGAYWFFMLWCQLFVLSSHRVCGGESARGVDCRTHNWAWVHLHWWGLCLRYFFQEILIYSLMKRKKKSQNGLQEDIY